MRPAPLARQHALAGGSSVTAAACRQPCALRNHTDVNLCTSGVVAAGQGWDLGAGSARRLCVRAHGQARETLTLPTDRDLDIPIDGFDAISDALEDVKAGKFLVVLDDESRENEGDLIIAADKVDAAAMAFMVEYTSGVVCIGMEGADLDRLNLPLMVRSDENEDTMYTAFTVTVDLRDGITTGISASDRAKTLRTMADPAATAADFRRPGHIFPLRCRPGGVLVRPGHTEASVDLARLAGSFPAGVLSEIVNKRDGSMARTPDLLEFAKQHGLKCISIADLMRYRLRHEQLVTLSDTATVTSRHGPLTVHTFTSALDGAEHMVVVMGDATSTAQALPVSVQPLGSTADLLGCSDDVLARMAMHGHGAIVHVSSNRQGERPSLARQVQRLAAGASASDDDLDLVDHGIAAQMLAALKIGPVSLLGSSVQLECLAACGVKVQGMAQLLQSEHAVSGHANGQASSKAHAHAV